MVYTYLMEHVSCNELWRLWMINFPDNKQVVQCQENISKFSKDDWAVMALEATELTENLGKLVLNKVPLKSKTSEDCFDEFLLHLKKWFFEVDREWILNFIINCQSMDKMINFFDRFQPGLASHLSKLCIVYLYKLPE